MKKLLSLLIALVMSFTLVFGTVACKKNTTSGSTTESSDTGSTGGSSDTGSGSGDVEEEIDLNYAHTAFKATVATPATATTAAKVEDAVEGDLYIKFDGSEIDAFAAIIDVDIVNPDNANVKQSMKIDLRYIGGTVYFKNVITKPSAEKPNVSETEIVQQAAYLGSFNDLFAYLEKMAAEQAEEAPMAQKLALQQVPSIVSAVKKAIESRGKLGQLGLTAYEQTLDVKPIIDKVLQFLVDNKDKTLMAIIAGFTDESDVDVLEGKLKKIFDETEGDATVADVLDRLVEFVNSYGMQINLKALCDGIQAQVGFTTESVVNAIKTMLKEEASMPEENVEMILPAVTEGQTVYDYFYKIADGITINSFLTSGGDSTDEPSAPSALAEGETEEPTTEGGMTFEQIGEMAIGFLKTTTLEQAIAMVAGDGGEFNLTGWVNGAKEVVNKLTVYSKLAVDEHGYPTEIVNKVSYNINPKAINGSDVIMAEDVEVSANVDYAASVPADKANVFAVLADMEYAPYLKLAPYGLTKAQTEDALENGLEVEIVAGKGAIASSNKVLECSNDKITYNDMAELLYDDKKVAYIDGNKVVFTADFFKAVEELQTPVYVYFGIVSEAGGGTEKTTFLFTPITKPAEDEIIDAA